MNQYSSIVNIEQYNKYCAELEFLIFNSELDEYDINTLSNLINDYDEKHNTSSELNPVELLEAIILENKININELADKLEISKTLLQDISDYKVKISDEIVIKLSEFFKLSEEAFNRPYNLINL